MIARRALILILLVLLFAALACKISDTGGSWTPTQGAPADPANATAAYGAEEWHAQLTEMATTPEPGE